MTVYLRWMTDAGLVRRTLGGNREAFGILVERHLPMAHALAWGHTGSAADADDVVQDAFLKAFVKLDTLREAEKFPGWLAGIVRNAAVDLRAKAARVDTVSAELLEHLAAPARRLDEEEVYALLREAVLEMEGPAREVLTLHYFAQKPLREVAELQGISREAAMKRLQRAREALGKQLLDKLEGAPRPAKRLEARKTAILAVVATTPFAWKAAAATGVSATAIAVATALLAILGIAGYASYEYRDQLFSSGSAPTVTTAATPSESNEALVPASPSPDATSTPGPETQTTAAVDPEHGGSMAGRILDVNGTPVPKATVRIERVNWEPPALPPAKTVQFEAHADENGAVSFTGLPLGSYSILAFSGNAIDVTSTHLSEDEAHVEEDLYLKPGIPLAGRVVDSRGAPVAGALLTPSVYAPMGPIQNETVTSAVRVSTDEKGQFRIGLIWPGGWQFLVRAKGFADTVSTQFEAGTMDALITMLGGGNVVGSVVRADTRAPMAKVRVRLQSKSGLGPSPLAESGDDGTFVLNVVAPGQYDVQLEDEYAAIKEGPKEIAVESGKDIPLDLVVGGGSTISGRVYVAATGEGIPGVSVNVNSAGAGSVYREVKSDPQGGFFFTGLPDGSYSVSVYGGDGYFSERNYQDTRVVLYGEREIETNIPMIKGVPVRGRVVDADASPVKDASVMCEFRDQTKNYQTSNYTQSKDDGTFVAWAIAGADSIMVSAQAGTKYGKPLKAASVPAQGLDGIVLTLGIVADSTVEAKIDVHGLEQFIAAQLIEVQLESQGGDIRYGGRAVRLTPSGDAVFKDVPAGSYTIVVNQRNYGQQICQSEPFDVPAGKVVSGVTVACVQDGTLTIAGHVLSDQGKPIAGAEIHYGRNNMLLQTSQPKVATSTDGSFLIENMTDGHHYLNATAPGYTAGGVSAQGGEENVVITLAPARVLRGRVRDAATGDPIKSFRVSYSPMRSEGNTINYAEAMLGGGTQLSADDGTFTIDNVGMYDAFVVAYATGYAPEGLPSPIGDTGVLEFSLRKGNAVSGTVTTPEGTPLSGVTVSLSAPRIYYDVNAASTTTTDINGNYAFEPGAILPGVVLHFSHRDFAITQRVVPESGPLDVVMELGGVLSGRVAPWPTEGDYWVTVNLHMQSGQDWQSIERRVEPNGTFSIDQLPTGTAHIDLSRHTPIPSGFSGTVVGRADAEIVNGRATDIVIELPVERGTPQDDVSGDATAAPGEGENP